MSADWDYAQLARTASKHGGPQEYLNFVKGVSKSEGRAQGATAGALLTVAAIGIGKKAHGFVRDYRARKALAAEAERELVEGMQAASIEPELDDEAPHEEE